MQKFFYKISFLVSDLVSSSSIPFSSSSCCCVDTRPTFGRGRKGRGSGGRAAFLGKPPSLIKPRKVSFVPFTSALNDVSLRGGGDKKVKVFFAGSFKMATRSRPKNFGGHRGPQAPANREQQVNFHSKNNFPEKHKNFPKSGEGMCRVLYCTESHNTTVKKRYLIVSFYHVGKNTDLHLTQCIFVPCSPNFQKNNN